MQDFLNKTQIFIHKTWTRFLHYYENFHKSSIESDAEEVGREENGI